MRSENDLLPPRYLRPTRIGYGGMGEIFRAEDEVLGRTVAIKVLSEQYARDESLRARFTREALAAARLSAERGMVTIFDVGEWEGRPFIVMEYLGRRLARGPAARGRPAVRSTRHSPGSTRPRARSTRRTGTASCTAM